MTRTKSLRRAAHDSLCIPLCSQQSAQSSNALMFHPISIYGILDHSPLQKACSEIRNNTPKIRPTNITVRIKGFYAHLQTNKMAMPRRSTIHHCPKASKGNCRKGKGTGGMPLCTKHQENCSNTTRVGKVCGYPRLKEEKCRGPCSR